MTDSVVTLCNMSLGRVGIPAITSLMDPQPEAQFCAFFYPTIRDTVLEEIAWRFATKRTTLTPLVATPEFEWDYQFLIPPDCLVIQKVLMNQNSQYEYQVNWQREGENILSDEDTLDIVYTSRITDTLKFSSGFYNALSIRLSVEVATGLRANRTLRDQMMKEYLLAIKKAGAMEGRQGRSRQYLPPTLVSIR